MGRIFGIQLEVDWSWFLIFFLITFNLGSLFGQVHPDWGPGMVWGISLAASLLFFISVLAHEMAHSLVAKLRGLPVRKITLFLFGGVSNIQREPPTPGTEFWIAIVGPVTSIALGFLFTFLGVTLSPVVPPGITPDSIAPLGPWSTLLIWLGPINVLLGLFNLLPGFPLDGGRILRSIFWAATGDLTRSTRGYPGWVRPSPGS